MGRFEIALYGSKGIVRVHYRSEPGHLFPRRSAVVARASQERHGATLPGCPANDDPSGLTGPEAANKRIVEDLIRAIETGKPSVVSGHEARATLEMIMAVYASHLQGGRATFPLKNRQHPLGEL